MQLKGKINQMQGKTASSRSLAELTLSYRETSKLLVECPNTPRTQGNRLGFLTALRISVLKPFLSFKFRACVPLNLDSRLASFQFRGVCHIKNTIVARLNQILAQIPILLIKLLNYYMLKSIMFTYLILTNHIIYYLTYLNGYYGSSARLTYSLYDKTRF
jgi:hypothetical protein